MLFADSLLSKNFIFYFSILMIAFLFFKRSKSKNVSYLLILFSKMTVTISKVKLPELLRPVFWNIFIKILKINKGEILDQDLTHYETLQDLFVRKIDVSPLVNFS